MDCARNKEPRRGRRRRVAGSMETDSLFIYISCFKDDEAGAGALQRQIRFAIVSAAGENGDGDEEEEVEVEDNRNLDGQALDETDRQTIRGKWVWRDIRRYLTDIPICLPPGNRTLQRRGRRREKKCKERRPSRRRFEMKPPLLALSGVPGGLRKNQIFIFIFVVVVVDVDAVTP